MFCASIWMGELTVTCSTARGAQYAFSGSIYVENESFHKIVGIHYLLDGQWRDLNATYSKSLLTSGGNRVERWLIAGSYTGASPYANHIRFAAYYHNLDWTMSRWDNNGGNDFSVPVIVH